MKRRVLLKGLGALGLTSLLPLKKLDAEFHGEENIEALFISENLSDAEIRDIVRQAYIYGFPMVDSYRIQYAYFENRAGPEFKAGWNQIYSNARVYTDKDKAVQTPNSDTPYSFIGADLRTEPLVLTIPQIEKKRYFSVQLIDAYTFNFAYIGSRTTGNGGGIFLLAGPAWKGEKPNGVKEVIRSETEFVLAVYRTQLFNPEDIGNVMNIQAGYNVQKLSEFLDKPAPPAAPAIDFIKPLTREEQKNSLEFFSIMNFVLSFCPTHPSEKGLMAKFAGIGIGAGHTFDVKALSPEKQKAFEEGIADAWNQFAEYKKDRDSGKIPGGHGFGTREFLKNNYLYRMGSAVIGIYGNSKEEAKYESYFVDSDGNKMSGANKYTIHFAKDQLPPVNAFWSLTMYELPSSLLTPNPLNRYLINSSMLPQLKKDAEEGITLYIQYDSPERDMEPNWLPAPEGPFSMVLRLYWPKAEALDGTWKKPPLKLSS